MLSLTRIISFPSRVIFHATQEAFLAFYHLIIGLPFLVMSAFVNAYAHESGREGASDAGNLRATIIRPHGTITDLNDDLGDSIELTDVDEPGLHAHSPIPPAQMPTSSRSRQVSLRMQSILPQSSPPESDSEDGDDTGSSRSRQFETHFSPIQLNEALGHEGTPSSNDMSSSAYSTPAELLFGPQSIPFVLRRRALANTRDDSPSKGPIIPENYRPVIISAPAIVQSSVNIGDQDFAANIGRLSASWSETIGERPKEVKLSAWRMEQIKYTKRAHLAPNATLKPIPALHGPLSLPYSRNPR